MVTELQLRVLPEVAYVDENLKKQVAKELGLPIGRIGAVIVAKRSIDARQRIVMVNLKLMVYVDERPASLPIAHAVNYKPLPGNAPSAIVVGMGPGGLFAALRLIELGVRPVVLE